MKRLLAYSSIGHAGFLILGITALSASTPYITWYYLLAYSLSSIASFWVLLLVSEKSGEEDITAFNGLVKRNPVLAGTMTIALLSMAGIPPLAGFFAKYFILINVIDKGYILIAVVAILASLIGVYYYFKIIIAMFTGTAEDTSSIEVPVFYKVVLVLISIILLAVGVVPDLIFSLIFR